MHWFRHVFWVLMGVVSLEDSHGYPQHRISVARYEKEAQVMEVLLYTGLNMCFGNSWELSH